MVDMGGVDYMLNIRKIVLVGVSYIFIKIGKC